MLAITGHAKKLSDLGIVIPNRLGINRVLQSLPPSYKNFVMNYNMQNMNKELPELFAMLKSAEIEIKKEHQVLMVNKTTSFKKQGKSKGKNKKSGKKAATPPVKPKAGPKPDAECYYCKEKGHWKRNCSKYLADLKSGLVKKKKEAKLREFSTTDTTPSSVGFKRSYYFRGPLEREVDVVFINNRTCDRLGDLTARESTPPPGNMPLGVVPTMRPELRSEKSFRKSSGAQQRRPGEAEEDELMRLAPIGARRRIGSFSFLATTAGQGETEPMAGHQQSDPVQVRPPGWCRRIDVGLRGLLLASTTGQELVDDACHQRAHTFPLAAEASQERTAPAASALLQVVFRRFIIEGSVSPFLLSPLQPPEEKKKEKGPSISQDPGGQISTFASTTGHRAPYRQTAANPS
ncbi:hypothetical protein QYE76_006983 [Lolium multiflorum]|uniref:CCHC-type domain-containing protein n=1 Tax=Lolium multiflorum TaxID=4521 RepID=A0AAD8RVT4_LOLMU|nr:hypothetical protein QYE76_006983 [Lolium multiflorum]